MRDQEKAKKRQARAFQAFALAALSCVLGLTFCLIKSPQSRAESYIGLAASAMQSQMPQEAAAAAMEAVRLNPVAPEGWRLLSMILQKNGRGHAARQAMIIATRLQHNDGPAGRLYADPAALRFSLLALAETDIP